VPLEQTAQLPITALQFKAVGRVALPALCLLLATMGGMLPLARVAVQVVAVKARPLFILTAETAAHPATSQAALAAPQAARLMAQQAQAAWAQHRALAAAAALLMEPLQRLATAETVAHRAGLAEVAVLALTTRPMAATAAQAHAARYGSSSMRATPMAEPLVTG
jgi:hypothetical protein